MNDKPEVIRTGGGQRLGMDAGMPLGTVTIEQAASVSREMAEVVGELLRALGSLPPATRDHLLRRIFVRRDGLCYDPGDEPAVRISRLL